ncbi:flagellar biosynthetic protein FliO [uncultured Gilvimarinus sp.]|mgnify:CR=1 FL=1|uniref:flagellar biosynthetic protein FliO n=1 Tax=uncultured Gilvimarinus sp. TaxID=1689143 RepID=UPI0030D90587
MKKLFTWGFAGAGISVLVAPVTWAVESATGTATITAASSSSAVSTAAVAPVGADTLVSVLLGLLGIIALILALAWFAKRAGATGWSRSRDMKVVASLALGTRERLLVVDVANTQILLGVTAQSINQLHVFTEPVINTDGTASSDFSQKLKSIMKGQGVGAGSGREQNHTENNDQQGHKNAH